MTAKTCIVILGMHRSGTSALTRLCSLAGAALPQTLLSSPVGNRTGHWESKAIAAFHDDMLHEIGHRWDDFRPVEFTETQRTRYRDRFCDLVDRDFGKAPLIVLKEPRMARFAQMSLEALESMGYRICIMHAVRHPLEVAHSLQKRDFIPTTLGALYWLRHVIDVETSVQARPHSLFAYEDVIANGASLIRQFFADHDLPNPPADFESEAAQFLDPALRHHTITHWSDEAELIPWLKPVYEKLCADAPKPPNAKALETIRDIGNSLAEASGALHQLREHFEDEQIARVELEQDQKTLKQQKAALEGRLEEAKTFTDHVRKDLAQVQSELKAEQDRVTDLAASLQETHDSLETAQAQMEAMEADHAARYEALETQTAARILELETLAEFEAARAEAGASHIASMQASTSWRITRPARELIRLWRNKTRLFVGFMAGLKARELMESDDLLTSADAARSPAVREARKALQRERWAVLGQKWLGVSRQNRLPGDALPCVTISVVTYNSERWLDGFFRSLIALDYRATKLSIHFVDHGSTDGTTERLQTFISENREAYRDLQLTVQDNLGYGAGNDRAIRASTDDFVLVTNVDIEFYPSSLRRAVAFAMADTDDVACWEFRQTPHEHPKYYDPVTLETNWNSHACVLIRRAAYMKVGGYDRKIFMYGEDVELSYRFRANGYRLRYMPYATVLHHVELDNAELRPNQLSGSTAANVLLRYRYGSYMDIAAGEALLTASIKNEDDPRRARALDKARQILRDNRWHFWRRRVSPSLRRKGKVFFPFNEFDYDVARVGADVVARPFRQSEFSDLPLVSVITRTHGPSDSNLRNAIASVLNQTYPNIEHIIVEDRTDDGREIVEAASARFGEDRIRYVKSPGEGRSQCGNYGASVARGEWLCWLDNDDLLFADHVETLMRALQDKPKAVASYALAWDAHAETVDNEPVMHQFELPDSHRQPFNRDKLMRENFIPIQSITFRKDLFDRFGGFNEEFSQLEDWNLWIRYSEVGPFVFTPKITSIYLTPLDRGVRQRRQKLLNDAYESVSKANARDVVEIRKALKTKPKPKRKAKTKTKPAAKNPGRSKAGEKKTVAAGTARKQRSRSAS